MRRTPRVLAVGGSDSGGGAGIEADLKTITALGGYGATAITALTAQDSRGVHDILPTPAFFTARQIALVLADIGADAIKTGMLGDAAMVEAVAGAIAAHGRGIPLVIDPVLRATDGRTLLAPAAVETLKRALLPLATLLTPNLPEAEALGGMRIPDLAAMKAAAAALRGLGVPAVLLKGGHLAGDTVADVLAWDGGMETFTAPRIPTRHTHGTGCTLASAIATHLGGGLALVEAVARGREFLRAALLAAPGFGAGNGPLGHAAAGRARPAPARYSAAARTAPASR